MVKLTRGFYDEIKQDLTQYSICYYENDIQLNPLQSYIFIMCFESSLCEPPNCTVCRNKYHIQIITSTKLKLTKSLKTCMKL